MDTGTRGVAAISLLLLAGSLAAQEPAEGEWERPWEGLLPDPRQGLSKEGRPESRWLATRILDASTGLPVPGARLLRTPESIAAWRLRHDAVMSTGVADAFGVARVPSDFHFWKEDCHWLAMAPGYAADYDYGRVPDGEMRLHRGVRYALRILDPMGRPVAGARVDALGGCSHGTASDEAVAGADGVAVFERLRRGHGQFWVEGKGIASDLLPVPDDGSFGTRPTDVVMTTGKRFEGRVVDLLGRPIPGTVVRVYNEQRGPATVTGPDGRFALEGAEGSALYFFHPAELDIGDALRAVDDGWPDAPMTVVLTPAGVPEEEETARVVVRARFPDGKPAAGVSFRLVNVDTGRGPRGLTEDEEPDDEDDPPIGSGIEEVVPGTFRVLADDPFSEFEFDPAEVRVAAGKEVAAEIVVRPRARLRVRGSIPGKADTTLAIPGDEGDGPTGDPEEVLRLPATGPAVVRVEVEGRAPVFLPVGPAKDGFRDVEVAFPEARRVPIPAGARDARLLHGGRGVVAVAGERELLTDATGPLVLRWRDERKRTMEVPADRPQAEARVVGGEVAVRAMCEGKDGAEEEYERHEVDPGTMVVIQREGWATLRHVAGEGAVDLRWGTAALRLVLTTRDGGPADALVLVAGEVYAAPGGVLELKGLDPGPCAVVATLRDEEEGGRELRLLLEKGKTRERAITLGAEE
jgi:hypothetical protein